MKVSIVIPIYNEIENLQILHGEIREVMDRLPNEYEVIFVDDGSNDGSQQRLQQMAHDDPHVRDVQFRRNYGQTAAMQAVTSTAPLDDSAMSPDPFYAPENHLHY